MSDNNNLIDCWPDEWWADTLGNERRYWSDVGRMLDFLELKWGNGE